jgi:anti-anti-sigma factor
MSGIDMEHAQDGIDVLVLTGEHDLSTAPDVERRIDAALASAAGLAIDLSETTFIDSAVLRVLITAQERAAEQGVGFAIAVPESSGYGVHRLLSLTGLNDRLATAESREAAVAAAQRR